MSIIIDNNTVIWLMISIILFCLGYTSRTLLDQNKYGGDYGTNSIKEIPNHKKQQLAIKIDDSKYVTNVSTDNLEKKYNSLGDIKESSENIESSITKLKNLKR